MFLERRLMRKESFVSFGGGEKDRYPSFAGSARRAVAGIHDSLDHIYTARKPHEQPAGAPVFSEKLEFTLKDREKNAETIRALGKYLRDERKIERIAIAVVAPAGAGGKDQAFLKLRQGTLETHTPDGQVTLEYAEFLAAAEYTTGTVTKTIIDELAAIEGVTGSPLFDEDSQLAMIGYNNRGYAADGKENPAGDPLMTPLYSPMDSGKRAGKQVAIDAQKSGYQGVTVYDTVEIISRSSDVFPSFEAIVVERLFTRMYHNADARKNPFWKELFEHLEKHYPDFQKLGEECHNLLYGETLLSVWKNPDLTYGQKCSEVSRLVREKFGGKIAEIRHIAWIFSQRADKAFGVRLAQALQKHEFKGQPTAWLGYEQLANTDVPPQFGSQTVGCRLDAPVRCDSGTFETRPRSDRADVYGLTYPLHDGSHLVTMGAFIDVEHMGVVPGVCSFAKALNANGVDIQPNVEYKVGFEEMIRPGQRISFSALHVEKKIQNPEAPSEQQIEVETGKKSMAISNETAGKTAATIEYAPFEEKPAEPSNGKKISVDVITLSYTDNGTTTTLAGLEAANQTTRVDEAGIREYIPHRGSFQFARDVKTGLVAEGKLKKFLSESVICVDRNGGLELLIDAFAQAAATSIVTKYNLTLFRGFEARFTLHAFEAGNKQIDICGKNFKVKTLTTLTPSTGIAKSKGIIENENGNIVAHLEVTAVGM